MSKYVASIPVWVRALLIVVAIPAMWAAELWMGLMLVRFPEIAFGEGVDLLGFVPGSLFSVALGLSVLWTIYKTPFMALSLAFPIVHPAGREGGMQQ